jgi:starch synthase (maltosyl-transferring)
MNKLQEPFSAAKLNASNQAALTHILIEHVTPQVECGRYPAKSVVGHEYRVEADIFRDGHQIIRAALLFRRSIDKAWTRAEMAPVENDRWRGHFIPTQNIHHDYTVEAWTDRFASWLSDFEKKVRANRDVASDLEEGIELLGRLGASSQERHGEVVQKTLAMIGRLRSGSKDSYYVEALSLLSSTELAQSVAFLDTRPDAVRYEPFLTLIVDRPKALFSAWYEMFPRSQSREDHRPSSLRQAEVRLSDIHDMGFDVVYLPPVHPIGVTNRKGPNNSLVSSESSPGSPWAIGSLAGGHEAVEPGLGTVEDFEHFVRAANNLGMEVALDLALQCSPDHPWVREHPAWFMKRPDGTIKYAENPPKEYQDIYPINFDTSEQAELCAEILGIVRLWIERGVTIFRVDNPHTKPVAFWEWLIRCVQAERPDVIFLAEAFTRPKMMKALAKAGFTQSYTYFTWRNTKAELTEYLTELTQTEMAEYFRPNFFTNTPDILPPYLQSGGRPAFKSRLVLAATLSPSYGIYSGFELCENEAIPGTEEYSNSEKYEIRVRDWHQAGNIREFIALINRIRQDNPALQELRNLTFLPTDNEQIIFYLKTNPDRSNMLLIAVNLDPHNPHHCTAFVPPEALGLARPQQYQVTDLITGAKYVWQDRNYVRLDPAIESAHILHIDGAI